METEGKEITSPSERIQGQRVRLSEFAGRQLEFQRVLFFPSYYGNGDYAVVQFGHDGEIYSATTGARAVVDMLKKYQAKMPFVATLSVHTSKRGRTYYLLE